MACPVRDQSPCGVSYVAHPRLAQASWSLPGLTGEGRGSRSARSGRPGLGPGKRRREKNKKAVGMIRRNRYEGRTDRWEMKMSRGQPKANAGRSGRRYSLRVVACRVPSFPVDGFSSLDQTRNRQRRRAGATEKGREGGEGRDRGGRDLEPWESGHQ